MSNVKLQASASGTGTVTIAPPVTNSDLTINLPANSGTVPTIASVVNNGVVYTNSTGAITSSSALTFDGTNLGVGTTSPTGVSGYGALTLNGTTGSFIALRTNGTDTAYIQTNASSFDLKGVNNVPMILYTNNTEKARIDSSGNLGLGVTPNTSSAAGKTFQIRNTLIEENTNGYAIWRYNNYFDGGASDRYIANGAAGSFQLAGNIFRWYQAASGTAGNAISFTQAMTLDASGRLGVGTTSPATAYRMSLTGDGSAMVGGLALTSGGNTAYIGQVGATSADCEYWNAANGYVRIGTNNAERARITSAGNLQVGTSGSPVFEVSFSPSLQKKGAWVQHDTAQPYGYVDYYYGAFRSGYILWNNTGLSLTSLSDVRMKKNIQDADSSLSVLSSLRVRQFDWKTTDKHQNFGFIAQELNEVFPEAVGAMVDETLMWGIDNSKLVPVLVKAIQEQQAMIQQLQAEVAALKGT